LLRHAIQATDPLAAVTQRSDTLDFMRALEGRDEEVPWKYIGSSNGRVNMTARIKDKCTRT